MTVKQEIHSKVNSDLKSSELPSIPAQTLTIVRFELLNYFRSRRFLILLSIALAIGAGLTGLVAYYGVGSIAASLTGSTSALQFYSTWWGFSATFIVVFSAIFFGGDAISGEFQNRTGYFLFGNPIRRSSIFVGKWIAAFTASLLIIAIFTAITLSNGVYYFGANIPSELIKSLLFTLIYLVAALGFTFFFSSLFKTSSMSILVTAILLLFGFTIIDQLLANNVHVESWFSITYGAGIIRNVLQNPYPSHVTTQTFGPGGGSFSVYNATIPEGLTIMGVYFIVTSILGLLLFERKETN